MKNSNENHRKQRCWNICPNVKCKEHLDIDNGKWSVEEVDIYMYLSDDIQHQSYIVRLGKTNIIFNTNNSIIYKICDGDTVNADMKEIIYS